MDPVSVALTLAALAKAFPAMVDALKSFAELFAEKHSIPAADLIRAIDGDGHERVDASVDATIETIPWGKP